MKEHDYSKYEVGRTYYVVTADYDFEMHHYFFKKYEDALEYAMNWKPKDYMTVWLSSWVYDGKPFKETDVKTIKQYAVVREGGYYTGYFKLKEVERN